MMDLIVASVGDVEAAKEKIAASREALKETGSLVLIGDWLKAYDLKPAADEAFRNDRALRNEIVWVVFEAGRRREHHATVLWYVKDARLAPFVELPMPRSRETIRRFGDGRIRSAVNPHTKRRAPTRIEGASSSTSLNDVWVWDDDACVWLSDLDEIKGEVYGRQSATVRPVPSAEFALFDRLMKCSGHTPETGAQISHEIWS